MLNELCNTNKKIDNEIIINLNQYKNPGDRYIDIDGYESNNKKILFVSDKELTLLTRKGKIEYYNINGEYVEIPISLTILSKGKKLLEDDLDKIKILEKYFKRDYKKPFEFKNENITIKRDYDNGFKWIIIKENIKKEIEYNISNEEFEKIIKEFL